jgi:soluble lytic murein transglycosylase
VGASDNAFEERTEYRSAMNQIRNGKFESARKTADTLRGYVIEPYLRYHLLRTQLNGAATAEVTGFLEAYAHLPATRLLQRRWLKHLGAQQRWQTLLDHYDDSGSAEVNCYYLRALYRTGQQQQALARTAAAWAQPASQPKACDPLFDEWRKSSWFTEDVVWERMSLALAKNERRLARYLLRYLSGAGKTAGEAFYAVHVDPTRITRTAQFREDDERYRQIISHGIERLARRDAKQAAAAWRRYDRSHDFGASEAARLTATVALAQAEAGDFPRRKAADAIVAEAFIDRFAVAAIAQQNWDQASYWIGRLAPAVAGEPQWRYWRSRVEIAADNDVEVAREGYRQLAQMRHYYGFLAANQLGLMGELNEARDSTSPVQLTQVRKIPSIARSVELFAVEDDVNARREWFAALQQMTPEQQIAASALAKELGLLPLSISTANGADANDHLRLRFPIAFEPQFHTASHRTNLPVPFLFAIARQESAMDHHARSHADARGLMQLLPSTARLVAQRAFKAVPDADALYDPGTNIDLGSYHMAWLMQRYTGQSALAIAAYNAGEHRVDRWIENADGLPLDIWIETIPFFETRNYVKNVLAFRHVYGRMLATPRPFIDGHEWRVSTP